MYNIIVIETADELMAAYADTGDDPSKPFMGGVKLIFSPDMDHVSLDDTNRVRLSEKITGADVITAMAKNLDINMEIIKP